MKNNVILQFTIYKVLFATCIFHFSLFIYLLLQIPLRVIAIEIVLLKDWSTVTDRVEHIFLIHALLARNLLRHDAVSAIGKLLNAPEL